MTVIEKLLGVPKSPPFLFDRSVTPEAITGLSNSVPHALLVWLKEAASFRRDPLDIVRAGITERQDSWGKYMLEGFEFLGRMDLADRAINGFLRNLEWSNREPGKKGPFGELLKRARNNPLLSDHNTEHDRRFERFLEWMLLSTGNLRHGDTVKDWIDSMFINGKFHDVDQAVSLQRNIDEERNGTSRELKTKKGHGVAPVIMAMATHRRYAEERKVRVREAWDIVGGFAFQCARHDDPEQLGDILAGKEKAFSDELDGRRLYHGIKLLKKFESNQLDLTTISPSQYIEIMIMQKGKARFIDDFSPDIFKSHDSDAYIRVYLHQAKKQLAQLEYSDKPLIKSILGLAPAFEWEYYKELLEQLENNRPILERLDERRKQSLKLSTEITVKADFWDMVGDPEFIYRLMNTQFSLNRTFWPSPAGLTALLDEMNIKRDEKGEEALKLQGLDILIHAIFYGDGNVDDPSADSDARRVWWQFLHMTQISGSLLDEAAAIKSINRDMAIMGVLYFADMGKRLMRGETGFIDENIDKRILGISRKALKKAGYTAIQRAFIIAKSQKDMGHLNEIVSNFIRVKNQTQLAQRYRLKIESLQQERANLKIKVAKGKSGEKQPVSPPHYSDDDIKAFTLISDRILEYLITYYKVSQRDLKKFRRRVAEGKSPSSRFFSTYDSVAGPEDARTLIKPLDETDFLQIVE